MSKILSLKNKFSKLTSKEIPPFGIKDKIGYAFGDLGCNFSFALISSYMEDFYTQYIGIGALAWTIIIIVSKIWDGVNDPIMGGLMDRKHIGKSGSKFKPWMKIGMVGLIFTGALVFIPIPNAPLWVKVLVCILTYLAWDVSYTLMNVPYGALNNAISANPQHRTQLSTWRSIGAGLGGVITMVVLPIVVYDSQKNLIGGRFIWIGLAMGVASFFAYYMCLKLIKERVKIKVIDENNKVADDITNEDISENKTKGLIAENKENSKKYSYLQTLKGFLRNRPLVAMCLASIALIIFLSSCTKTTKWLFQTYFDFQSSGIDMGLLLSIANVVTFAPMVCFIPFTNKLTKRFGKKLCAGVPLFISVVASVILISVNVPKNLSGAIGYIIGLMFIQVGGGIFQLVCWAMITDCVDYQQIQTGRREDGSVYAMYSLFRKIAQGVASSLPLLSMTWVGYNAKANPIGNQAPGVSEKMIKVAIGLMLIGSVIMLISLLWLYNIDKKKREEMNIALGIYDNEVDINNAIANSNE